MRYSVKLSQPMLIYNCMKNSKNRETLDPTVIEILKIVGVSGTILASFLIPGFPLAVKPILDVYKRRGKLNQGRLWGRFNQRRLRFLLKRLQTQKVVEINDSGNGKVLIQLTKKGRKKLLEFELSNLILENPPLWDKKWRLIIYDVKKERKLVADIFRRFLKKMQFLKLQKSVYLTPYPCQDQVKFLREYYNLDNEVLYLEVQKLENEEVYKDFFKV